MFVNPPPPFATPHPRWGGPSLGPKSIGNTWRRRNIFFRLHWNWGGGSLGEPPPPPWGGPA